MVYSIPDQGRKVLSEIPVMDVCYSSFEQSVASRSPSSEPEQTSAATTATLQNRIHPGQSTEVDLSSRICPPTKASEIRADLDQCLQLPVLLGSDDHPQVLLKFGIRLSPHKLFTN